MSVLRQGSGFWVLGSRYLVLRDLRDGKIAFLGYRESFLGSRFCVLGSERERVATVRSHVGAASGFWVLGSRFSVLGSSRPTRWQDSISRLSGIVSRFSVLRSGV